MAVTVLTGVPGRASTLPTLHIVTDTPTAVTTSDGRTFTHLTAGEHLLADALAQPGQPVTYTAGTRQVTVTRPEGPLHGVYVAGRDGRSLPDLAYEHNGAPAKWTSDVHHYNAATSRWPLRDPAPTGTGSIVVLDPTQAREDALAAVLQSHSPIMLVPARRTDAVYPRCVVVDSWSRKRVWDTIVTYEVAWTSAAAHHGLGAGRVPAVTWGEWQAYADEHGEGGWQRYSALRVAQLVQGVPA